MTQYQRLSTATAAAIAQAKQTAAVFKRLRGNRGGIDRVITIARRHHVAPESLVLVLLLADRKLAKVAVEVLIEWERQIAITIARHGKQRPTTSRAKCVRSSSRGRIKGTASGGHSHAL